MRVLGVVKTNFTMHIYKPSCVRDGVSVASAPADFRSVACFFIAIRFITTINQTVNDGVAHSKNPRKCAYHVTFDLDLDLEHILDAC